MNDCHPKQDERCSSLDGWMPLVQLEANPTGAGAISRARSSWCQPSTSYSSARAYAFTFWIASLICPVTIASL